MNSLNRNWISYLILFLLIFFAILWLIPVIWMLVSSLKPESEIFSLPPRWISDNVTLENYIYVLNNSSILRWFVNSILVTVIRTSATLIVAALAAYGFARVTFIGKNFLFFVVLGTLMVPISTIIVPQYLHFDSFGLLNSYWGVILPGIASPLGVFLLRQFFLGLPRELEEAAFIDGSTRFGVFWRIALPLAKPVLAALGIFTFIYSWNDFLWPLIVLSDSQMYTLTIGIATLQGFYSSDYGVLMAGAFIASFPVIIFFVLFQKNIVKGIARTGIKG